VLSVYPESHTYTTAPAGKAIIALPSSAAKDLFLNTNVQSRHDDSESPFNVR